MCDPYKHPKTLKEQVAEVRDLHEVRNLVTQVHLAYQSIRDADERYSLQELEQLMTVLCFLHRALLQKGEWHNYFTDTHSPRTALALVTDPAQHEQLKEIVDEHYRLLADLPTGG